MISPHDLTSAPWSDLPASDMAPAQHVLSMLGPEERKMYFWLACHYATDAGAVVDLGAYVGGSTAYLAAGGHAGGRTAPIHAYDRFEIHNETRKQRLLSQGVPTFEGVDILPAIRQLLAPWQARVTLHAGDIRKKDWQAGPIELLVVDAAKHADTCDHIAATFFPHLIPGRSILVHQDFLNARQPWIAAQMALLADYFEPLLLCGRDCVVFLNTQPLPAWALAGSEVAGLSDAAYLRALRNIPKHVENITGPRPLKRLRQAARAFPHIRSAHTLNRAMKRLEETA